MCIEKRCLGWAMSDRKVTRKIYDREIWSENRKKFFSVLFLCFLILKKLSFLLFDSKSLSIYTGRQKIRSKKAVKMLGILF